MQNKHIIVHLTEVLVSYFQKYNIFNTAPVHYWNFSRENFNVYSLPSFNVKRDLFVIIMIISPSYKPNE